MKTNSPRPTALIADDEPLMRASLREHLELLWPELDIVAEAADGPQALRQLGTIAPDFAFLDIRMPGLSGLQVAQLAKARTKIVFVTAYDNHALEAFEANAVDYVVKPVDPRRLGKVVAKLGESHAGADGGQVAEVLRALEKAGVAPRPPALQWLQVAAGAQIRMVFVDEVIFFESDTKYTRVVSQDCEGLIRTSLKELLAQLPEAFIQVHRSAVVNRHFIHALHRVDDALHLELKGQAQRLRVSDAYRPLFKAM